MKDVGVSIRSCGQNIIWKVLCTSSNASVLRISSKKLSKVQFCEKKNERKKKEVKTSKFFFLEQHNFLWLKITFFFFHKKKKVEKISNWPSNRTIIACTNCSYIPLVKELYVWEKIYPTKNYIFDIFFTFFQLQLFARHLDVNMSADPHLKEESAFVPKAKKLLTTLGLA